MSDEPNLDDVHAWLKKHMQEDENGKIGILTTMLDEYCAARDFTHADDRYKAEGTLSRREWIESLDLQTAKDAIQDLCKRVDEMTVTGVQMMVLAANGGAEARKLLASKAGKMRLTADPKQAAKVDALRHWEAWQRGELRFKSGAAFARSVVEYSPIESTKTVERWMKDWTAAAKSRD